MSNADPLPSAGQTVSTAAPFVAATPLEQLLEATCQNKMQMDVFLNQFINNQVMVLLNQDPGNPPQLNQLSPVTFNYQDGRQYMVTFTSPDRVKPFVEKYPQFQHAIGMHVGFLIQSINNGVGIAVNPGSTVGFEWHAPGVQEAKTRIDWSKAPWNQPAPTGQAADQAPAPTNA